MHYGRYAKAQAEPGEEAEIRCANDLVAQYGGEYRKATLNENKYQHKDIIYTNPNREGKEYSFDVKMVKKIRRFFQETTDKYHWVEFHGGHPKAQGWVNGEQDWVAFETFNDWIFVDRETLKEKILEKMDDSVPIKMTKENKPEEMLYKWYAHNDFDKIVLVETELLRLISKFIVKKQTK